jgi:hypothetical protein
LITSYSDVVDFLKSSETDLAIGLVLIAIGVKSEYRYAARSLSRWGPNGESDAPVAAGNEIADLLRRLKQSSDQTHL